MKPFEPRMRLLLCVLLLLSASYSAAAQSGRRQTQPPPSAPVPTPTPEPTPTPKRDNKDPGVGFIVSMYTHDSFASYPIRFADIVLQSCADRLRSASSASVEVNRQDVNRGEASKKAKDETNTYVVWLQLTQTTMNSSSSSTYSDLEIEYTVFAPGTGKVATTGRTYQGATRKGPVVLSPPGRSNNSIYAEQLLKIAAEDAADRILHALHISSGDPNHPLVTNFERH